MKRLAKAFLAAAVIGFGGSVVASTTVLIAPRVVMPDGSLATDRLVEIDGRGRIRRVVGAAELPSGTEAVRLPEGSVLSPGLIDLMSRVGVWGQNDEPMHPIDPEVTVADAFAPDAPDLAAACAAGITAAMIVPRFDGLVDGAAAMVRTAGQSPIVEREAALVTGLGEPALQTAFGPTSRAGALFALRDAIPSGGGELASARFAAALNGELPVFARAVETEDVSAWLRFWSARGVAPVIVHADDAVEIAEELAEYEVAAVVGPYGFTSSERLLHGAAALDAAGVPVAFASGYPASSPDQLRMTAALAVRYGMSPESARRAMTSEAARLAGMDSEMGRIAPGCAADLVLFSGDPLRLDSRVLKVWVGGEAVELPSHSTEEPAFMGVSQ